jgi:hypothetical protein
MTNAAAINDNNKGNSPAGTDEPVLREKVAFADDNENTSMRPATCGGVEQSFDRPEVVLVSR